MALTAVQRVLELIDGLSEDDRELLEERLAQRAETAWPEEVEDARRKAEERGIDQDAMILSRRSASIAMAHEGLPRQPTKV